jgi:hypothetical protein
LLRLNLWLRLLDLWLLLLLLHRSLGLLLQGLILGLNLWLGLNLGLSLLLDWLLSSCLRRLWLSLLLLNILCLLGTYRDRGLRQSKFGLGFLALGLRRLNIL